ARIIELIKYSHIERGTGMKNVFSNGMYGAFGSGALFTSGYNRTKRNDLYTQIRIKQELPFIKGLSLNGSLSYDINEDKNKRWTKASQVATVDTFQYPRVIHDGSYGPPKPRLENSINWGNRLTLQGGLNYSKLMGQHSLSILGLFEARSNLGYNMSVRRQNYNLFIDELSMGSSSATDLSSTGSSSLARQVGVVFRGA